MEVVLLNQTWLLIESKREQILSCVRQCYGTASVELESIRCDDLGYKTPNFTTAGIFHVHGNAKIRLETVPYSLIVKVIRPESAEKNTASYHNYWRREAHIFESRLLDDLPAFIQTPACYLVEEQQDGSIWLWLEHIIGEYAHSQEQFELIARQLGRFNGRYLTGQTLPHQEWICRGWLRSWITASRKYAPNPQKYLHRLSRPNEHRIWAWFQAFDKQVEDVVTSLESLPRVLAHQDLSQRNMLMRKEHANQEQVVFIDWQFLSLSGIGEDLGKMVGVNMSLGCIPPEKYNDFQHACFHAYMAGVRESGWQGEEEVARYGYCMSTALRSVWEVPQYLSLVAQLANEPQNTMLQAKVAQLEQIIMVHMEMAQEAEVWRGQK